MRVFERNILTRYFNIVEFIEKYVFRLEISVAHILAVAVGDSG
jgi:hypothetical protein